MKSRYFYLITLLTWFCFVDLCDFLSLDNPNLHRSNKQSAISSSLNYTKPCTDVCAISFKGSCSCYITNTYATYSDIYLECSNTNASILSNDIDYLTHCNLWLIELTVKNSNLTHLYNLPSGLYNIQKLTLDNTGIDLETIRESQELLKSLNVLRISNENFTEIPESLFIGMEELKELSLNNLGMAYINADAFISLQDSLTLLELRSNKIRTIPSAVQMLSHLEYLDLSGNDIRTIPDASTVIFSTGLKRLKRLRMNPLNCSCEFGKSKFATWVRTHAIKGVICRISNRLLEKDVFNTPIEEFCETLTISNTNRLVVEDIFHTAIEEFCQTWNTNSNYQLSSSLFLTVIMVIIPLGIHLLNQSIFGWKLTACFN